MQNDCSVYNVKEHKQKSVSIRFLSFSNINFLKKYATFYKSYISLPPKHS